MGVLVRIMFTDPDFVGWFRIISVQKSDVEPIYKLFNEWKDRKYEGYPDLELFLTLLDTKRYMYEEDRGVDYVWEI